MLNGPDHEILSLLRRRDPRGFDQAYERYGPRLFSFLKRLLGGGLSHHAEDLLQQTFLSLAEHGPELRPDSDLRAWLFTVARHAFLSHARKGAPPSTPTLELVANVAPELEARLLLGDVEAALARLRLDDRELLLLVGGEGLEPLVVAKMLRLEPATLRKRLARARQRLLAELERDEALAKPREASS